MKAVFFLLFTGLTLAACTDNARTSDDPGARAYKTTCSTCHQPSGQGIEGVYPPLSRTEWVNGDEGRLIRLVLSGMSGPVEVNGVSYNNVMISHDFLSDDQIAAVLTFIRSSFGNSAGPVDPDDVSAVRAETERGRMWTPQELETRTGIPAR